MMPHSFTRSPRERVPGFEGRKPAEIAIHRPEFANARNKAGGGDPGIVDHASMNTSSHRKFSQLFQQSGRVAQNAQAGGLLPCVDLVDGLLEGLLQSLGWVTIP